MFVNSKYSSAFGGMAAKHGIGFLNSKAGIWSVVYAQGDQGFETESGDVGNLVGEGEEAPDLSIAKGRYQMHQMVSNKLGQLSGDVNVPASTKPVGIKPLAFNSIMGAVTYSVFAALLSLVAKLAGLPLPLLLFAVLLAFNLGFIALFVKDPALRRYHGAEHMALNTHRDGKPLEIEHMSKASRISVNCGTNILATATFFEALFVALALALLPIWAALLAFAPVIFVSAYFSLGVVAIARKFTLAQPLMFAGFAMQLWTTSKPTQLELTHAQAGLKALLSVQPQEQSQELPLAS